MFTEDASADDGLELSGGAGGGDDGGGGGAGGGGGTEWKGAGSSFSGGVHSDVL